MQRARLSIRIRIRIHIYVYMRMQSGRDVDISADRYHDLDLQIILGLRPVLFNFFFFHEYTQLFSYTQHLIHWYFWGAALLALLSRKLGTPAASSEERQERALCENERGTAAIAAG